MAKLAAVDGQEFQLSEAYLDSEVPIVDSPPPPDHLVKGATAMRRLAASKPGLIGANEVNHVDAGLEVPVGGHVLVVGGWSDVVSEAQAVVMVTKVHVDEALVGAVKGDAPLSHGHHGVVVAHVGGEDHDSRVEKVGPSNVGCSCKILGNGEELIGGSVSDNISVDVDNFRELCELPEVDFGEGGVQVGAIHKIQVGRAVIANTRHGEDVIIHGLEAERSNWSATCCRATLRRV